MEFPKEQVLESLTACADFCCGECHYKKFEHQDYTWRCIHKLIVDVNTLLTEKGNMNESHSEYSSSCIT